MTRLPEISVIVPVYNVSHHVAACIASIRAQTFDDFEVIVVDDGSTDDSLALAREAAGDDPRFLFLQQENAGLSAARNAGLAEASGVFVSFVDSDDRIAPTFLQRLRGAVIETDGDWAACAVRLERPDGTGRDVSAIHGQRHPAGPGPLIEMPLDTWTRIVAFWPSAWNKLYRRTLIEGMRFVAGTYYEDHPWYQEAAARTDRLIYLPEPLYIQTQGRAGQITRDGSERVFEQIDVLEQCARIMETSDTPEPRQGLQRLATRLLFERSTAISDPDRRRRFAEAGRRFLAERGLRFAPKWDPAIAHSWGRVLDGELPLTVVVATDGTGPGLGRSLASLARQTLRDFETLIVQVGEDETARRALLTAAAMLPGASVLAGPGDGTLPGARNRGLDMARGHYVVFLDAGDTLAPATLWLWVEGMLRSSAGLGLSPFRIAGAEGRLHAGSHDGLGPMGERLAVPALDPSALNWDDRLEALTQEPHKVPPHRALQVHAHPSAKIFRRRRLLESEVRFPDEPLSSWHMTIQAALVSRRMIRFDWAGVTLSTSPVDRRLWREAVPVSRLIERIEAFAPLLDPVMDARNWRATLFARAVWEKINYADFPDEEALQAFEAEAAAHARLFDIDPDSDEIDPYIGPRIRAMFAENPEDHTA